MRQYLELGEAGKVINGSLYVHGGVMSDQYGDRAPHCVGKVPGRSSAVESVQAWVEALNRKEEQVTEWVAQPLWVDARSSRRSATAWGVRRTRWSGADELRRVRLACGRRPRPTSREEWHAQADAGRTREIAHHGRCQAPGSGSYAARCAPAKRPALLKGVTPSPLYALYAILLLWTTSALLPPHLYDLTFRAPLPASSSTSSTTR